MKTLIPFILSTLIPGAGQLYTGQYLKGILMLIIPFIIILLFDQFPIGYAYIISQIVSLVDLYLIEEKREGKQKAFRYLIFGLLIVIVIIPSIFYLFAISMHKGGNYVVNNFYNEDRTKNEMTEISLALEKYYSRYHYYPNDFLDFISSKPIWHEWSTDAWDNNFKYTVLDSSHFILVSSGKDQVFETKDDISISSITR